MAGRLNDHRVDVFLGEAEQPAQSRVELTVRRASAAWIVLSMAVVHPEHGPQTVDLNLSAGEALLLAKSMLDAVCAPAPEVG